MALFPRTKIETLSVSRLLMGTNWWLGYSHTSASKDKFINEFMTAERIADCMEVFLEAGVDGFVAPRPPEKMTRAIQMAEDRTGRKMVKMLTPWLKSGKGRKALAENRRTIRDIKACGGDICMPHQSTTDALLDRRSRTIRDMDTFCKMIRDEGMIPGLSTHMPEAVIYADETGLDVGTYIQIYNAHGFLMQVEVEWCHQIIMNAKKPVITIKPLGVNRLPLLVALTFSWNTLRDQDMVCIGTTTPDEVREVVEMSLSILERRKTNIELQKTRSKASLIKKG